MQVHIPSHFSNEELAAEMKRFAHCEREATADLVGHLVEFDRRGLHLEAGFSSLFVYCCEMLQLTEHETYHRIAAARVVRRFPVVLDLLHSRSLNVTTVELLAKHLTQDNHAGLLAEASGLSKRAVEELLARRFPRPDTPSSVRKVPAPRGVASPVLIAPALTIRCRHSRPADSLASRSDAAPVRHSARRRPLRGQVSSTTSGPMRRVARRPSTTSSFSVPPTIAMRPSCLSPSSGRPLLRTM